jgi:hypothetical protein
MLFTKKRYLSDQIVEIILQHEIIDVKGIISEINTTDTSPTFQGIYKALQELVMSEVLVKQGVNYSINNMWLLNFQNPKQNSKALLLQENETVSYRFTNISHLDSFYKHNISILSQHIQNIPIFHAVPHHIWFYLPNKYKSETMFHRSLRKSNKNTFTIIGGKSPQDISIKKLFVQELGQCETVSRYPFNRRDHITVLGPYIITVRLSLALSKKIDTIFNSNLDEILLRKQIEIALDKPGATTLTIINNEQESLKIQKKYLKYFHVPRNI